MKIFKKIFITILILATIGSLSYGSIIAKSMYEKYNDTIKWKNSSLQSKIHQVPSVLAQNYISVEEQEMLAMLTEVNIALEEIKEDKGIKADKFDEFWDLHDSAISKIEESEEHKNLLEKGFFSDFSLYLSADLAIKNAYEYLEIENLEEYELTFSSKQLKEKNEIDKVFLDRIQEISKDLANLELFSNNAISKLGIIEDNILKVDVKVNRQLTTELLEQIEKNNLDKFSHIKELSNILNSESWDKILTHNESSLEYYSWKENQKILDSLLQSNYVSISSFNTVEDVLSYSPNINLEKKENHTINNDSVVKGVYYNGDLLNDNLYVKKGTSLNFVIEYEYTEDPKSTVTIEYFDVDGNQLDIKTHEGYVGSDIVFDKDVEGYVLFRIENELQKFPEEDTTIRILYEKYVPVIEEPVIEDPGVEEEPVIEEPVIEEPVIENDTQEESNENQENEVNTIPSDIEDK